MSLFALFALQKSANKSANESANIRTIRSPLLLKCEQLFALQFCARMETLILIDLLDFDNRLSFNKLQFHFPCLN